jgi:gamma-glutamylcyclotransferase (GGCT)/AIG2-like uncharacterized protein YtfP
VKLLAPALAYFALAFAAGFALGMVRVPFLMPAFGERIAILIELPFLLLACVFAARFVVARFAVPARLAARLTLGAIALALLLGAELLGVLATKSITLDEYIAGRDPVAGAAYLVLLGLFAAIPALMLLHRSELLFSYGTLQLEPVQRATFGRRLAGTPDTLPGYRLGQLEIKSDAVVATSGVATHPIVHATGNPLDLVAGTVFRITPNELFQADAYEVDDYERVRVTLASGTQAWVYAAWKPRA